MPTTNEDRFLVNRQVGQVGGVLNLIVNWPRTLSE
jgi:hypothetical protein